MKISFLIGGVLLVVFIGIQLYALKSQYNIETYPYKVIEQHNSFEIRRYEARLFSTVKVSSGNYKSASSQGFSALAGYIFGGNDRNEKIAMTSPVTMTLENSMTMRFMVPKKWNKKQLPKPNQSNIHFVEEPEKLVAAIKFKGWASDRKIKRYKKELITALKQEGIPHLNKFELYGYNAPFEVFNRRNEIVVELIQNF